MNDASSTEMYDRMLAADGRFFRWSKAKAIFSVVLAVKIVVVAFFVLSTARGISDLGTEALMQLHSQYGAVILHLLWLAQITSAVMPCDAGRRRLAKYAPIPNRMLIRSWLVVCQWLDLTASLLLVFACAYFVLAGIPLLPAAIGLLWHCLLLAIVKNVVLMLNSRRGRWGGWLTIHYWVAIAPLLILPTILLSKALPLWASALITAPAGGLAFLPLWLGEVATPSVAMFAVIALVCCYLYATRGNALAGTRPSRHRIRQLLHSWRSLPDRESPAIGNLSYSAALNEATSPVSGAEETLDSQQSASRLRRAIAAPRLSDATGPKAWQSYRVVSIVLTLAFAWTALLLDVAQAYLGAPSKGAFFGTAALMYHIPAVFATISIAKINSTTISRRQLCRLNLREVFKDTIVIAALLMPNVCITGFLLHDFSWPACQLFVALLITGLLRCTWMLWFADWATAGCSIIAFFAVFLSAVGFVSLIVPGVNSVWPAAVAGAALLLFRYYEWHRTAAWLQRWLPRRVCRAVSYLFA